MNVLCCQETFQYIVHKQKFHNLWSRQVMPIHEECPKTASKIHNMAQYILEIDFDNREE